MWLPDAGAREPLFENRQRIRLFSLPRRLERSLIWRLKRRGNVRSKMPCSRHTFTSRRDANGGRTDQAYPVRPQGALRAGEAFIDLYLVDFATSGSQLRTEYVGVVVTPTAGAKYVSLGPAADVDTFIKQLQATIQ